MVHLFATGRGWVVPAATFASSLIAELIIRAATGEEEYYQRHGLPLALALSAGALATLMVYLSTVRLVRDAAGRVRGIARPPWMQHSFMFISIGAWPAILLACAIMVLAILGV